MKLHGHRPSKTFRNAHLQRFIRPVATGLEEFTPLSIANAVHSKLKLHFHFGGVQVLGQSILRCICTTQRPAGPPRGGRRLCCRAEVRKCQHKCLSVVGVHHPEPGLGRLSWQHPSGTDIIRVEGRKGRIRCTQVHCADVHLSLPLCAHCPAEHTKFLPTYIYSSE